MIVTLTDYLMDRDRIYPQEYNIGIKANAELTVEAVNVLIKRLEAAGVTLDVHPVTRTIISSGWRPPQINRQITTAAIRSKHMTAQACDLYDPEGLIDEWVMSTHPDELAELGLFYEHPSATKGWSHCQTVPPKSGRRIFYP